MLGLRRTKFGKQQRTAQQLQESCPKKANDKFDRAASRLPLGYQWDNNVEVVSKARKHSRNLSEPFHTEGDTRAWED